MHIRFINLPTRQNPNRRASMNVRLHRISHLVIVHVIGNMIAKKYLRVNRQGPGYSCRISSSASNWVVR